MKLLIIALISIGGCVAFNINYEPIDGSGVESSETNLDYLETEVPRDRAARIAGGREATAHQFPFIALIYKYVWDRLRLCAGSIITDRAVLTLGACTAGSRNVLVIAGAHNRLKVESSQQRFQIPLENVRRGPAIEMIILKSGDRFIFNSFVQPSRLPTEFARDNFVGETAAFAGWGSTSTNGPPTDTLHYATAPVISREECRLIFSIDVAEKAICVATPPRTSMCNSGGNPLFVRRPGHNLPVLVGIGWQFKTPCELNRANGFIRVSDHLDWIKTNSNV